MSKKAKRINKAHDKVIKQILEAKQELINLLKDFMGVKLERENIENFNIEYREKITFKTKLLDIVYKIKAEESFIVIEHQSTVDYKMGERMTENETALISSREEQMENNKNRKAAVIYPIVLSTAKRKWDAPLTIEQDENNRYKLPVLTYPKYNVIDINKYSVDYLLEKRTGIAVEMAFEKIRNKEDLEYIIKKLKEHKKINYWEKRAMGYIVREIEGILPIIAEKLTRKELEVLKKEMISILRKEGDYMSNFEEAFKKIVDEEAEKRMKKGIERGVKQGVKQGIIQVAKQMIKNKISDEIIMESTNLSKKEIEELKLQMA